MIRTSKAIILFLLGLILLSAVGCSNPDDLGVALKVPKISVISSSIDASGTLKNEVIADRGPNNPKGENQSPHLAWDSVNGAKYYAVCMYDETASWLHWLVWDVNEPHLEQGAYTDAADYMGPYPPANSGKHNYRIEVFALKDAPDSVVFKLDSRCSYSDIIKSLNRANNADANIIARGYVMGKYGN